MGLPINQNALLWNYPVFGKTAFPKNKSIVNWAWKAGIRIAITNTEIILL